MQSFAIEEFKKIPQAWKESGVRSRPNWHASCH